MSTTACIVQGSAHRDGDGDRRRPSAADGFGPRATTVVRPSAARTASRWPSRVNLVEQAGDADAGQEDDDVVAVLDERLDPGLDLGGGVDDGLGERGRPHDRRAFTLEQRGDGVGHAGFEHADGAAFERRRGAPGAGGDRVGLGAPMVFTVLRA